MRATVRVVRQRLARSLLLAVSTVVALTAAVFAAQPQKLRPEAEPSEQEPPRGESWTSDIQVSALLEGGFVFNPARPADQGCSTL